MSIEESEKKLAAFIYRQGYFPCNIPACNCNSFHGGHASERLRELRDELEECMDLNGKTILQGVQELRRFKAAALTLTSEASVQHVMDGPYLKNAILVHHTGQSITSADVEEAMSKEKT